MGKRLGRLALATSLALCAITAAIWVRSYWQSDAVLCSDRNGHVVVQWARGIVAVGDDNAGSPSTGFSVQSWNSRGLDMRFGSGLWGRLGFARNWRSLPTTILSRESLASFQLPPPPVITVRRVSLPLWLPFALSLALPASAAIHHLRPRHRLPGLCPSCGYDLRATPTRCPECGTEAPKNADQHPAATAPRDRRSDGAP